MQPIKAILFDFDGTLADTAPKVIQIGNRIAGRYGIKGQLTEEVFRECQGMQPRQALKHLGIPMYVFPFFARGIKKELIREILQVKPFEGMSQILSELYHTGIPLGILTSNTEHIVGKFLLKHGWNDFFQFIEPVGGISGKGRVMRKILRKEGWEGATTAYIGDEVRDIIAAHKNAVISISVTWGLNNRQILSEHAPRHLVESPAELQTLLKNLAH